MNVYDKEGANPTAYTNATGTARLTGFNNDAIKIGVIGNIEIKAEITLQALDPYLDHMTVVCQATGQKQFRTTQDFSASDFSVNGGVFHFYLPDDLKQEGVQISFEDLRSKYFDDTYTTTDELGNEVNLGKASNHSRINFVKSAHNTSFTSDNIYNNTSEAKNAQLERLIVSVVGTQPFKFNNADEVGAESGNGGILTEYPFTLANYAATPNFGAFDQMNFTVSADDQVLTRYVFTTDETRYNIAPTKAVQHRAYAYYQMEVHVQSKEYEPKVKFTKVYDKTFYLGKDKDNKDVEKADAFYGVEVTAPYVDTDDNNKTKQGYVSTNKIYNRIEEILNTDKKDDFNNTDLPASAKQILYLDLSKLAGVYQITTQAHGSMEEYSATNAANCMIFLPKGANAPNNNVAYLNNDERTFTAANNIVITDKQPFFSPYDIQLRSTNYATYSRLITVEKNGKVGKATVILPFNISIDNDGYHGNDDMSGFNIYHMVANNPIKIGDGDTSFDYGIGYFNKIGDEFKEEIGDNIFAKANKPYMVFVPSGSETESETVSFIVKSTSARIAATGTVSSINPSTAGFVTGETATGKVDDKTGITFTSKGSFRGLQIDKARQNAHVFYFAKNYFLNSSTLVAGLPLNIFPFRSYYEYPENANLSKLQRFSAVFGENDEMGGTNGITDVQRDADLAVIPGNGGITLVARTDKEVSIHAVNGQTVDKCNLRAGESRTVAVPAGIYVINGVKMVVK